MWNTVWITKIEHRDIKWENVAGSVNRRSQYRVATNLISVKSTECAAVVYMDDWPIYLWISSDKCDTMWIMCSDM